MKIQVKINKRPFSIMPIVGLLKECDQSLTLRQAKQMVEEEIKQDTDDILEFDLPNGTIVGVHTNKYIDNGAFEITIFQGDKIPKKLDLTKAQVNTLKPGTFVLVRDAEDAKWKLDVFSHIEEDNNYPYACITNDYTKCIPYEGNEHLLNKDYPTNLISKPKYDNEEKRYQIVFGNECAYFTDQELYNFITAAVLHNRDIRVFTVVDTKNMPSRE